MIHIIGCSGFIGKAIQKESKGRNDVIFYSSRIKVTTRNFCYFNLKDRKSWDNIKLKKNDKLIFLSWKNLPNFNKKFHLTENLLDSILFMEYILNKGLSKIIVAGTCYEYGLQNGQLLEDYEPKPLNCYAYAKNCFRQILESLCKLENVELAWIRIFYPYGIDQNPNSLYPSLMRSIKMGDEFFPTSPGDQIRDFIKVEEVSKAFLSIADNPDASGIINLGSGKPISVKDFLEKIIKDNESEIKLKLGVYKRREDEPFSFWADTSKLNKFLNSQKNI